jgi:exopolysaccharide biosynthesis polyprenyl glycosylphosphotransferase
LSEPEPHQRYAPAAIDLDWRPPAQRSAPAIEQDGRHHLVDPLDANVWVDTAEFPTAGRAPSTTGPLPATTGSLPFTTGSLPSTTGSLPAGGTRDITAVLPYPAAKSSKRTRALRAWMLAVPVDLMALLAPLLWTQGNWKGMIFTAVLTTSIFAIGGLYHGRRHLSILDELPSLCGRLLASAALVAIIAAWRHDSIGAITDFLRSIAISAVLVIVGRSMTRFAVLFARRRRWVEHNAIIVGGGPIAAELARLLRRYPDYGLRFVGFVDSQSASHAQQDLQPLIGSLDEIETLVAVTRSDVVIIADVNCPDSKLAEMARRPALMKRDLWVVPRLREFFSHNGIPDHIGAIPVTRTRRATLSGPRWAMKRTSDIIFAVVALVLLSPILLLCAIATRIEGGPGIFFRQQRVGRHGKLFDVIKFRSMRPTDETESNTNWNIARDPRIGPVGRIMRRTSLDELPQLWNILRGDMTVVGPRPERPFFVDQFSAEHPEYALRHRVPAGLTGLAQVSGLRGDTPISDRARFDNYYIENWSLWLDLKVILRTVGEVFSAGGR